ncbi:MAG: TolC family protein [Bacteroidales bacterium]
MKRPLPIASTTAPRHLLAVFLTGFLLLPGTAQDGFEPSGNPALERYIGLALESNLGLRQKQLDYAQDLAALQEARGLFFPDVSLHARYTVANGGRRIEFPVGDMLNPVYSTLNMLTSSTTFPQIENESFAFYRAREHETKLSLVQPIYSAELIQNQKIRKEQLELTRIGVEQYRRELVREVTLAYHAWAGARQMLALADSTLALVRENLRVSRRLFENDKVTVDAVYRSETELSRVLAQKAAARTGVESARAYFNFLLNRELQEDIELVEPEPWQPRTDVDEATARALAARLELDQLDGGIRLNDHVAKAYRGNNLPGLYGVVDYGFQGEEYRFTGEDDFVLASLVLSWDLFQGSANRNKVQQARIERDKLLNRKAEAEQQIRLQVIRQHHALLAAWDAVQSTRMEVRSARRAYELIARRFEEGQASLLELIDARTALTGAESRAIGARGEYFATYAEYEYVIGSSL